MSLLQMGVSTDDDTSKYELYNLAKLALHWKTNVCIPTHLHETATTAQIPELALKKGVVYPRCNLEQLYTASADLHTNKSQNMSRHKAKRAVAMNGTRVEDSSGWCC